MGHRRTAIAAFAVFAVVHVAGCSDEASKQANSAVTPAVTATATPDSTTTPALSQTTLVVPEVPVSEVTAELQTVVEEALRRASPVWFSTSRRPTDIST